jgi:hypothetical protein
VSTEVRAVRLRASDDDRHAVVRVLQDATARGLLTHEEGGERMAAAWAARYRDDLPPLTADLPAAVPAVSAAAPAPGWRHLVLLALAQLRTTAGGLAAGGWRTRQGVVLLAALLVVGLLVGLAGVQELLAGPGGFPHRH